MSRATTRADEIVRSIHQELHGYQGPPRAPDNKEEFAALLERLRREARERLTDLGAADAASPQIRCERGAIYFYACGLVALGRADALVDVVDHWDATSPGSQMWRLAGFLTEGLPLPRRSDGIPDPGGAKRWVHAHVAELAWDEKAGRFATPSR